MAEAADAHTAGDAARSEAALRRALGFANAFPAADGDRIASQAALAEVLSTREGDEAPTLYRAALAACPAPSPEAAALHDALARALALRGQWEEAARVLQAGLAMRDAAGDDEGAALSAALLADIERAAGRPTAAEPLYTRALAHFQRQGAARGAEIAATLHGRGLARLAAGSAGTGCADLTRAVVLLEASAGADSPVLAAPLADLAVAQAEAGDAAAGATFARVLALVERQAGAEAVELVPLLQARSGWHATHQRWDDALADGERQARLTATADAQTRAQALDGLVALCVAAGRPERARAVSAELVALLERELPADAPDLAVARRNHAGLGVGR